MNVMHHLLCYWQSILYLYVIHQDVLYFHCFQQHPDASIQCAPQWFPIPYSTASWGLPPLGCPPHKTFRACLNLIAHFPALCCWDPLEHYVWAALPLQFFQGQLDLVVRVFPLWVEGWLSQELVQLWKGADSSPSFRLHQLDRSLQFLRAHWLTLLWEAASLIWLQRAAFVHISRHLAQCICPSEAKAFHKWMQWRHFDNASQGDDLLHRLLLLHFCRCHLLCLR